MAAVAPVAFCADDSLRDAMQSDAMMKEASARLESLTRDMNDSNVFAPENIASNRDVAVRLTTVHATDMQEVLRALERSLQDPTNQAGYLRSAKEGHERIAETVSGLGRRLGALTEAHKASALAKVQAFSKAADALAGNAATSTAEQQQKADELARDIRAETNMTANAAALKNLAQAAAKLVEGKPQLAAAELKKAVTALEQESAAHENALAATAAKQEAMNKVATNLSALAAEAVSLAQNPDVAKASEKAMDLMVKAEETAKALDHENAANAAAGVRSAESKLAENKFAEAGKDLQTAATAAKAEADKMAADVQKAVSEQAQARDQLAKTAEQIASLQKYNDRVDSVAGQYDKALQEKQVLKPDQGAAKQAVELAKQAAELAHEAVAKAQKAGEKADEQNAGNQKASQAAQAAEKADQVAEQAQAEAAADQAKHEGMPKAEAGAKQAAEAAEQAKRAAQMAGKAAQMAEQVAHANPQDAKASPDAMNSGKQKDIAAQLETLAKDLKSAGLSDAAKDVSEAESDSKEGHHSEAKEELSSAKGKLSEAIQAAKESMKSIKDKAEGKSQVAGTPGETGKPGEKGKPEESGNPGKPGDPGKADKPEKPSPASERSGEGDEDRSFGTTAPAGGIPGGARVWKSGLPPNERQSLLSGQQEKSSPIMEEDAKRYFERLAK